MRDPAVTHEVESNAARSLRTHFILVAHAHDKFLANLQKELAATEYALLHAKDGQEAIDYLNLLTTEVALAIIQLELPGLSGLDVMWHLAGRNQAKPTKIIATSGGNVPLFEHVVKELGVAAIVRDPAPARKWSEIVETVMNGSSKNTFKPSVNPAA